VLRIPLSTTAIENGIAGRIIQLSTLLRNLHWLGAEVSMGMDAELAESLVDRETLLRLAIEEVGGSGGRFRQRTSWRGTDATSAHLDAMIVQLRPQLDEAVSDLFARAG
jgi:hypothetical protein